ncbi:UNVERIFIED_CONTAM: zinc finger, C3HC4 type (RING finger) domain-containing protein [Hammondia hammondi]|eukprot:XP_008886448.1 zinc finger, C3HC4 type (RING finger) domain-containing protein [Hammondia hammondi]
MSSCAGAPKRRRRLVGGTEEDAPGGEEEDQEGQEKLPLESEALLRQLIHQQRSSLHQYRREIACLQRQFEEQRREAAVAAQRREAVVTTWGELQSDVLLLKTRLASHVDPSLVRKLLDCPESSLLAPSIFATKAPAKSEGSEEAGEEPAACDATDGAASPALSFEAPLSSDSEDSEEESSSNSKGSPSAEQEKKRLDEELRRQREWTVELLRDFVAAVEARAGPEAGHEEKPDKTEMESSNGVACAMSEKVFFDRMRGALHKLREAARRHRRRARALERDLRAQKKETLALKVETDRLQKQQALLKYRFRVLSGASPESAASLLRAAGLRDEALEETPGARAETGVSPETPSGADGGPSAAQPGASGPQVGAPNGPEAARADAGSRLSPGEPAPEKGDTGGDSAVGRVGSGEGSFDFLPPTTAPEEILEHLESLQRKLREREKEITRLQEERAKAEKLTAEVKILRTLNHELILQSSPYVELQQQAAKLEEAVVVRTAEVDELRRELLHEQKHKDEEFEKLLTETKEQTERLLEKMKTLTDELQSACIDREKALFEGERLRQELLHRKASQEEQETVFAQRCVQLSKLKMQHEQLKNAGTQMLLRNERMRKERQTLIEAIRQKDELICRLKLRLRAEERQKQEGVAAGNAASAHEISSSSTPSPTAEKVEPATDPTQNCVSGVAGTSAASPSSSPRDVPRDSLHGSALLSLDALELPGLEGDAETVEVQMAKMKLDKDALQRRLADYDQLVVEIAGLREQYARVSEEVEEVSKAFEERQTFCEHLLKQVKEKDEALADLRNRNASFLQQQQMLSRLSRLHDQKLLLLRQQYEQTTTNSRVYADALQQANVRVTLADQQREEATSIYQQMRTARDTLYKEKEEALAKLNTVVEANKVLDAAAQESLARRNSAENEARALVDAKVELEKRIDKLKAKEEKQDRKRAHTAALEELSVRDLQLLKDENETMRRRLVCFVCNERFKDHMINKCGHMFCQVCLERNVKTRNRKCPHCKAQFDQKDIRKVYLDN